MARLNPNRTNSLSASPSPSPSLARQPPHPAPTARATTTLQTIEQDWGNTFYTTITSWPSKPGERLVRVLRGVSKQVPLSVFAPRINRIIDTRVNLPGRKGGRKTSNITTADVKAYISQFPLPLPTKQKSSQNGGDSSGEEDEDGPWNRDGSESEPDEDKETHPEPLIRTTTTARAPSERYSLRTSSLSASPAQRKRPPEDGKGDAANEGNEQEQTGQKKKAKLSYGLSRGSIMTGASGEKEQQDLHEEGANMRQSKRAFVHFSQDGDSVVGIHEDDLNRHDTAKLSKIARTGLDLSSPFIYKARPKRLKVYSAKALSMDHKLPLHPLDAFRQADQDPEDPGVELTEDQYDGPMDIEQQQREETESLEEEQLENDEGMDTIVVEQEDILNTPLEAGRVITSPLRNEEEQEPSEPSQVRIDIPDSPTRPQGLDYIQKIWRTPCDLVYEFDLKHRVRRQALLTEESISCLCDKEWYNDEIMIFYTRLLQEQHRESSDKVWVCHSYFSSKVANWQYDAEKILKDWPGSFFDYQYVLFPTHLRESNHWLLVIADTGKSPSLDSQPRLWILDSLATNPWTHSKIYKFYQDFIFDQLPPASRFKDPASPKFQAVIEVPQQRNGYDCGPYSLYHVDRFLQDPNTFISNLEASNPSWSGFQVDYRRVICGEVLAARLASLRQSLDHQQKNFESSSSSSPVFPPTKLPSSIFTSTQRAGVKAIIQSNQPTHIPATQSSLSIASALSNTSPMTEAIVRATSITTATPTMSQRLEDKQAKAEPETLLDAAIKAYERAIKEVKEEVQAIMEQQAVAQKGIESARQAASAGVLENPRRKQARKSKAANAAIEEAQEKYHDACKQEVKARERLRVLTCKLDQITAPVDDSEDE